MTGHDEAVPAGRDLTAQDVRDAHEAWCNADPQKFGPFAAEFLNRIARPSGGVGQPDTAAPRSWSLPAPPPDDVTEALNGFRGTSGSLDDLEINETGRLTTGRAALIVRWLLSVVEGEPPAPEPKYAVSNWVRVPTTDGDTITVGAPALDRRPHPDARWDTRTETWEPQAAEPCAADGPRDALGIVRCVRTAGHDGDHQAHDSWNLVTWGNEPPAPEPFKFKYEDVFEPQAAEPPRFEREVESIASALWRLWGDVSPGAVTNPGPLDQRFSDLINRVRALAAAGVVREEG